MKRLYTVFGAFALSAFLLPAPLTAQEPIEIITTVAGNGIQGFSGDNGPAAQAGQNDPTGVAVDASGNVYVADFANHRVRRIGKDGVLTTVAGMGTPGFSGDGGPATLSRLSFPTGVTVDAKGVLYIADCGNHRIRRVSPNGVITTLGGVGHFGFLGDGGLATQASLNSPMGVAVDAAGGVYIADTGNHRIRQVKPNGVITTVAGDASEDGGQATQARLHGPRGMAVDMAGALYIADQHSERVRRVERDGTITAVAGTGMFGFSGDGGRATEARLNSPVGVASGGVDDGVRRYDGVKWTAYTPKDGLYGAPVYALCATQDGSLYAGTDTGISRFREGKWNRVFPPDGDLPWSINKLMEARDGSVWAGTMWGALRLGQEGVTLYTTEQMRSALRTLAPDVRLSIVPDAAAPAYLYGEGIGAMVVGTVRRHLAVGSASVAICALAHDGPGEAAGLKVGDRITAVDGQLGVSQLQLNGPAGASMKLTVQ